MEEAPVTALHESGKAVSLLAAVRES